MVNKYEIVILIFLFLLSIIINDIDNYFILIYLIIILYYGYKLYRYIRIESINKINFTFYSIVEAIIHFFLSYFLICDPNPFYYLFTFYLPFQNFFKATFLFIFHSYALNRLTKIENSKENQLIKVSDNEQIVEIFDEEDAKDKNIFFLSNTFYYFKNTKKKLFQLIACLTFLKLIIYAYDSKFWIYFNKKESILPISSERNTKYYITACVLNMEPIITDYIKEMKKLINYLGEKNIIVSIVENGDSKDNTREYLNEFKQYLDSKSIINKFVLTHETEDPRKKPNISKEEKKYGRILYLATLRNRCYDLLYQIHDLDFNNLKIINFNDIIFTYEDVVKLLATNNEDYDAVCAMDFYFNFYDSWVSIDLDGNRLLGDFPYFINKEGQDLYINKKPIRVFSCWNGIITFNGSVFENKKLEFRVENFKNTSQIKMKDYNLKTSVADSYESECSYFHVDMEALGFKKRFINPQIRVTYTYTYYYFAKYFLPNTFELFFYFKNYFKSIFKKRNKNMSDLKSKNLNLSSALYEWYIHRKMNAAKI